MTRPRSRVSREAELASPDSTLRRNRVLALGLYSVGALALGASMVLWSRSGDREPETRLGILVVPGGAHIGLTRRF